LRHVGARPADDDDSGARVSGGRAHRAIRARRQHLEGSGKREAGRGGKGFEGTPSPLFPLPSSSFPLHTPCMSHKMIGYRLGPLRDPLLRPSGGPPRPRLGTKTGQQDPTQAKCVAPPPTRLRTLAAAKGRSFGVSVDAAFFGANPAAYDTVVAREFNMIVAGNV